LFSIVIIKLIINLILWYCYSCSACDCVSRPKLFSAQFDELQNVYKIIQETLARRSSLDYSGAFCN